MSNVSKADIKAKLSQTLKTKDEFVSIFGLKTKFGGGRSTGFALIYDSLDAKKKYDSKKMLRRVSISPASVPHILNITSCYYIGRSPR